MNKHAHTSGAEPVSWSKVLLWVTLFFLAWNWQSIPLLLANGEMVGPDDYLRLHQVQNWMNGQGWFDLTAYRMNPPPGGDIHWSRLVDIPIAAIIGVLKLFFEPQMAWRIASVIWPLVLFLTTVTAVVAICDRLVTDYNRLLAVLFAVLCVSSIQEFVPGRLDHHNVQILLINLVLLGLVSRPGWTSDAIIGLAIPLSLSIGLDSAMLFVPALAYLGLEWSARRAKSAERLRRIGIVMFSGSLLLYALAFPLSNWGDARCDAFSLFYLAALLLVSSGFVSLAAFDFVVGFPKRIALGAGVGAACVAVLVYLFPHCVGGPFSEMDPEAMTRWLASVQEAKGIVELLSLTPEKWLSVVAYLAIMLAVSTYVIIRQISFRPQLGILYFILLICLLGIFFQFRVLRTGIYVVIPFCVVFAAMSWNWLEKRFGAADWRARGLQSIICIGLLSATWSFAGNFLLSAGAVENAATAVSPSADEAGDPPAKAGIRRHKLCFREQDMHALMQLPAGLVMSDLNSATAILAHTQHSVVSGPYHRNTDAILSVLDFFQTDLATAQHTARKSGADYVAICLPGKLASAGGSTGRLDIALGSGIVPDWLEPVSASDDRLLVFRIVK